MAEAKLGGSTKTNIRCDPPSGPSTPSVPPPPLPYKHVTDQSAGLATVTTTPSCVQYDKDDDWDDDWDDDD
ncbi:hypothetical protein MRX96_051175 [Rhipicephalus microplus]